MSCARNANEPPQNAPGLGVVSLDYCADQFVLKFVARENILALSPDATASFSYMKEAAIGLPTIRPRAEDVLLLKPEIVVRSYGGGPLASAFFERTGIKIVQIGYAGDLEGVKQIVQNVADDLGASAHGKQLVAKMNARLAAIPKADTARSVLYLTSKGASAGTGTLIDDLIIHAGLVNFQSRPGWGSIPLERLAYERPDIVATGFFDTTDLVTDHWSAASHPVAARAIATTPRVDLPGALTSCSGWFLVDAVEALAAAATNMGATDE